MASLEERVTALEARVDQLTLEQEHSTDTAVMAAREALTARQAHQKNIELLNALRKTQAEHSGTLADHTQRLDRIESSLGVLTVGVHSIESLLTRLVSEGDDDRHS